MDISDNTVERVCKMFGYLGVLQSKGINFVSSSSLAKAIGSTDYTIRKDLSLLGLTGFTRKGYEVKALKQELGLKFNLSKQRKACIIGLGRLGTALLDYEKFQEDGFEVVAGFDCSVNKIERIRTQIDVFEVGQLESIIKSRGIELAIIAVPAGVAQSIADRLANTGIKGVLNFSPMKVNLPEKIMNVDMDFTNALRFIAAKFTINT